MTLTSPAINLRAALDKNANKQAGPPHQYLNIGTGNAVLTSFAMPKGWKPLGVFKAGVLQTEGSANAWTSSFDGFVYSVVFSVAPATGNVILVDGWRV